MAGHSKWANIKHRKGAQDKKRSKIFTRIIKEITISSRDGGADPSTNPALRLAISNAKGANMPKDTIEKAIKRGQGDDSASLQELIFEGYAPKGVAVFLEATTDNNNRTVANVRAVFNKYNGSLGTKGSLDFLFEKKGVFTIAKDNIIEDKENFEMELIDYGLDTIEWIEDFTIVYTSFDDFGKMQKYLESIAIVPQSSESQYIPKDTKTLSLEDAKQVLNLIEKMEEEEDVNAVYHNLEITEELEKYLQEL